VGKDFRLIWLGRSLSIVGDGVIPAALALAVVAATGSAGALAFVLTCATVPKLALLPVGGAVADRWPARRVAIAGDVVRCVVQAVPANAPPASDDPMHRAALEIFRRPDRIMEIE